MTSFSEDREDLRLEGKILLLLQMAAGAFARACQYLLLTFVKS